MMNLVTKGFLFLTILACKGEPTRSYCEALCDWAVTCAEGERPVDAAALTEECLAATRASDGSCEKAETGSIDPASRSLLKGCVTAIDDKAAAAECDGFTGGFEEIKIGAPPAECTTQAGDYLATYNEARDATQESGPELCQRFSENLCQKTADCILGDFQGEIPQEAIDALGGTPVELCVERLDAAFTSECSSSGLYDPEDAMLEANLARQGARGCIPSLSSVACTDLFANPPQLSIECAAAFSSPDDLMSVGQALIGLSEDFAQYAP
jgi:hypothetical protein